jgi:hypothetical protein
MLRYWAGALAASICIAAAVAAAHEAQDEHGDAGIGAPFDCEKLPANAVGSLPEPAAPWVSVACRYTGQLLVESAGWQWRYPSSYTTPVTISAGAASPSAPGARYFTAVTVASSEAAAAAQLHAELVRDVAVYADYAGSTPPSAAYTLIASNDLGDELKVHFLPRGRGDLLGVVCAPQCIPESTFIVQKRGG